MASILPTPQSPLMSVVEYDNQMYYTSQYFHRQYLENSEAGKGKYRQHKNFLKAIRKIESYQIYIDQKDIMVIEWNGSNPSNGLLTPNWSQWKPLFKEVGFQPITFLNATAQAGLSHHLDDELSKQMSVAINTHAAQKNTPSLFRQAQDDLIASVEIARLFHAPEHIGLQEGVKYIAKTYGLDFSPYLLASPTQDNIPEQDLMLEPTELAQKLGYPSGFAMNLALEKLGWQIKRGGAWESTATGTKHSTRHAWIKSGKSGYNLKWSVEAVSQALERLSS